MKPKTTLKPYLRKSTTSTYPFYKAFTQQNSSEYKEIEFNQLQSTSSTMHSPFAHTIPTKTTTESIQKKSQLRKQFNYAIPETNASSTRNPIFDVYLKRVSLTTKSPYDFGNFKEYFKTTRCK